MDAGPYHYNHAQSAAVVEHANSVYSHAGPVPHHQAKQNSDSRSADTAAEAAPYGMSSAAPSRYGLRQPQPDHFHGHVANAAQVSAAQALGAQAFGSQHFGSQSMDMQPMSQAYIGSVPMPDSHQQGGYNPSAYGAFSSASQHNRTGRPAASSGRAKSRVTDKSSHSTKSGVRSSRVSEKAAVKSRDLAGIANGLSNCTGDSVKTMAMELVVPIVMMAASAFMHHSNHSRSAVMIPWIGSKWYNRVSNALYAISTYFFFKRTGVFKTPAAPPVPTYVEGTRSLAKTDKPGRPAKNGTAGPRSVRRSKSDIHNRSGAHSRVATQSLFSSNDTSDYASIMAECDNNPQFKEDFECIMSEFDGRWAVPKAVAKHYYNEVYRNKSGLTNTNAEMLGGAAAIRALRKEAWHNGREDGQKKIDEGMVMNYAMTEASSLLARKAGATQLAADDVVENVGRFALATIIQIKVERGQEAMRAQS
ncbi:hypothetical protein LPJ61_005317 [Coemansia biformis]|uniref:Uncharacterized protein n=1 Tax=Coemansia biformis TaxID=1286918 RepID=A0A9W8CTW4_9FUNG|nr:hypothetical protein LPJ61_005317 [Coemansia biformis]